MKYVQTILLLLLCSALSSCLNVEDVTEQWEKGTVDAKLEGAWHVVLKGEAGRGGESFNYEFIHKDDRYLITNLDKPDEDTLQARSYSYKGQSFLILKDFSGTKGTLFPYKVNGDEVTMYLSSDLMGKRLQSKFPTEAKRVGDFISSVKLSSLNDVILDDIIASIKNNENYWVFAKMTSR